MEIVSRIGTIQANEEKVFNLLSDFNNLQSFALPETVKEFTCDADSCSFAFDKVGKFSMKIIERVPYKLVKIVGDGGMPFSFNLWIQLKQVKEMDTRVKVTLKAKINMLMKPMVKKPLTQFVESLVTRLESIR